MSGLFVSLLPLPLPLFQHDMRAVIGAHPMLQAGDFLPASALNSAERETGPFALSLAWRCSKCAAFSRA